MRKINVAVLMGGRTAEHEVSLNTGKVIVNALNKNKYNVKPVVITKTGKWIIPKGYLTQSNFDQLDFGKSDIVPTTTGNALDKAIEEKIDVVFIAMHGPMGEDGTIQGLLEIADIPYTGSSVLSSSLAMNKVMSRRMFEYVGLKVPKGVDFTIWDWKKRQYQITSELKSLVGFPCVLKPVELGSSVGISIAKSEEDFLKGLESVFEHSNDVLIEEFIDGKEVTCAVLGAVNGEEPIPLVPTQIIPKTSEFFDYSAKYTSGATDEITPPRDFKGDMIKRIQEVAVIAHKSLNCGGMSRTDMMIKDDEIYVLELNTIPGMTELSLYPQAARAANIEFSDLLDRIIEIAIETHKNKKLYKG
ncbi:TPA: D-alanine--D-alanine ligase [Candidatus Poribacteria bacterium]|nr:D-alanine--D-alanine ligase [Candidatus Poribacteria bacterium]